MGTVIIVLLVGSIVLVAILSGIRIMNEKDKQPSADNSDCSDKGTPKKSDKGKRG